MESLYDILGIDPGCSFSDLKKAYLHQAKQCHPDLFGGALEKTIAFQRLVNAFDVLSDPKRRQEYDVGLEAQRGATPAAVGGRRWDSGSQPIMDTLADDILEELVVGNDLPSHTSLQTLMLDLAGTERFIMFREAKTLFQQGHYRSCLRLCERLTKASPHNILYHFFLAEAASRLGKSWLASRHYRICLQIGLGRTPPQRLNRIRSRYRKLLEKRGWLGRLLARFFHVDSQDGLSEEVRSRQILEDVFAAEERRQKRRLGSGRRAEQPRLSGPQRQLGPQSRRDS